jgi:hypothetical protein
VPPSQVIPDASLLTPQNNETSIDTNASAASQVVSDDPFEWLNIVFDKPGETTSNEQLVTSTDIGNTVAASANNGPSSFVDPFLSNKTSSNEITNQTNTIEGSTNPDSAEKTTEPWTTQPSLDAMLQTIDTNSAAPATKFLSGLSDKKRKLLMVWSSVLGVLVLAWASYLVFSTMYPGQTNPITENLQWNIAWPNDTAPTDTTAPAQGSSSEYNPWTQEQTNPDTTTPSEDELPSGAIPSETKPTPAEWFGDEDMLPNPPAETNPETTSTSTPEEELPTSVAPEVSKALEDLDGDVETIKQLIAVVRAKADNEKLKEISVIVKSIRSLRDKITKNEYTSFTTEIEPEQSKIQFAIDQLTAALIQ